LHRERGVSLLARLSLDQRSASREAIEASATLRDLERRPHDVTIDDISHTGCHVATLLDLPLDTFITLGIPEIGVHKARLIRETDGGYGCAFERALTESELRRALAAEQDDRVAFGPFRQEPAPNQPQRLTPPGLLGTAIVAAVLLSWAIFALILFALGVL
jgi:hypothetical protein